jgi:integral membrane protein
MNTLKLLRIYTLLEGASYLCLVLIAMPLKYWFGVPVAVRIAGGVHGLLFLAFIHGLYQAHQDQALNRREGLTLLLVSLIPGSVLWLDQRIRRQLRAGAHQ